MTSNHRSIAEHTSAPRYLAALAALILCAAAVLVGRPAGAASAETLANCTVQRGGAPRGSYWPMSRLEFENVWSITQGRRITDGKPVLVAVIDSGVNLQQPQLAKVDFAPFIDAVAHKSAASIRDCVGHGTAVTGIIAAQPDAGVSPVVGVAPQARILEIKDTGDDGKGTEANLAYAINAAADAHAAVVNISGGVTSDPSPTLLAALDHARRADMVVVAAAGNDQQSTNAALYPAALSTKYPNILAVSAVDAKDDVGSFSTSGQYVDLSAPGQGVEGLAATQGFTNLNGTSFAAPFVTGTVALLRAARPDMSATQVVRRLEATADPPTAAVPDPRVGFGVVNPSLAVTAVTDDTVTGAASEAPRPLPPRAPAAAPNRHLQHVAVGIALTLLGL
ncbi:MAG TPA: S8 family serine peptidase, partial [Jatrophihabitans sp.]|nr:S8 family serine peptidase [Jatrophihabitans sp.]